MRTLKSGLAVLAGMLALHLLQANAADVVINELMADNQASVVFMGDHPDWIEVKNTTDRAINVGGMRLTDDPALPGKFVFEPNTLLDARSHLIIWCDGATNILEGLHAGFRLAADGGVVSLFSAGDRPVLLDTVTYGLQIPDYSIGRIPDGGGTWQLTRPTPLLSNVVESLGASASLKINEWMAKPSSGDDWFELVSTEARPVALGGLYLTGRLSDPRFFTIASLSFVAPSGFRLFWADEQTTNGPSHVNFKLPAEGGEIGLFSPTGTRIDGVTYGSQSKGISQGRLPDGGPTIQTFLTTASPEESNYLPLPNVIINEVLSHTDPPFEDAIELYNPSVTDLNLSGWYLSNDRREPKKYRIPDGTTLPKGGCVVFYEYQFNADPGLPTSFTLNSAHGDEVNVASAANNVLTGHRTTVKFGAAERHVSIGRYVDKWVNDFVPMSRTSFGVDNPASQAEFRKGRGATNGYPKVGPIIMSEIMFHPLPIVTPTATNDNVLDEFIELHNAGSETVPLYHPIFQENTWRLANGVEFSFPMGVDVPAGGYLLVVSFDPNNDWDSLVAFRTKYGLDESVRILGPYMGKLGNGGDTIELKKPDDPQMPPHPDAGYVPHVTVERVKYGDTFPWPVGADGTGSSLQRINPAKYGNDPLNWMAAAPTPGRVGGRFLVDSVRISGASIVIRFAVEAGKSYSVQYRTSLSAGTWQKLTDIPAGTQAGPRDVTDPLAAGPRFYRIVSPAQL